MRSLSVGPLVAFALLCACTPAPAPLEWRIEFATPDLLGRAAVVDARILRGGCDGTEEVFGLELRPGDRMGPVPPPLDPGVWGFAAAAHDDRCARFAYDCDEIELPGARLVVNTLAAVAEMQVCSGARCDRGGCRTEDADMDGSGACAMGEPPGACDCDDDDPTVRPGAADACRDGDDQDCDGADDECDADCDGYPDGAPGSLGADCDDDAIDVHPNDGLREVSGRADGDRVARRCEAMPMPGEARDACAPGPSGEPVGDMIDQDCNGLVDDGAGCTDPTDRDRDGARACATGMSTGCDVEDCDPGIAPGRDEICGNGVDEDASGTDEACAPGDTDRDGHVAMAMGGDDCDDADPRTFPGAPDDCRTTDSEACAAPVSCGEHGGDADGDGYLARPPPGARGDCDDADDEVRPFALEGPCDGVDQDCDGIVDEVVRARPPATPGEPDACVRTTGGPVAIDYDVSSPRSEHCGGCGVATADEQDCCAGVPTAVNVPGSCGSCGFDCGPNASCPVAGLDANGGIFDCACAPDAAGDWADCDGSLAVSGGNGCETDLATDEENCGRCGERCGMQQTCLAGVCSCDPPYLDCDGMPANGCEVDGDTDIDNCRTCGNVCAFASGAPECVGGTCVLRGCDPGLADCNMMESDGCETRLDTLMDCGRCGETCAGVRDATEICGVSLACDYSACDGGFLDCDSVRGNGCEVDGTALPNCGACGNTCAAIANAMETCASGSCDYASCDANFGDCDSARANGCETSLRTTLTSCGGCGTNCNTLLVNTASSGRTCAAGVCNYMSCTMGFGDCDANRANGCEVNLQTTFTRCGSCATNCSTTLLNTAAAGRTCSSGVCTYVTCLAGFGDCDPMRTNGCETPLNTTTNCGACGNTCGSGETCNASGDCACGVTSSPSGPACSAGSTCSGGMCIAS